MGPPTLLVKRGHCHGSADARRALILGQVRSKPAAPFAGWTVWRTRRGRQVGHRGGQPDGTGIAPSQVAEGPEGGDDYELCAVWRDGWDCREELPAMTLERISTAVGLLVVICSIAVTFGIQMERLDNLRDTVKELKQQNIEIMKAIGEIEHSRWRERTP